MPPKLQNDVPPRTVFHKDYQRGVETPEKVILLGACDTRWVVTHTMRGESFDDSVGGGVLIGRETEEAVAGWRSWLIVTGKPWWIL